MAPSALPAPTTVCSSSMNRMILPSARLDFFQDGLQALLEFAAELRAGDQRAHVERRPPSCPSIPPARRRARCAAPALRRWRSCRRPVRRSAPGCSWCAATAPGSRGGSLRRGRSPDRVCPAPPAWSDRGRIFPELRRSPPDSAWSRAALPRTSCSVRISRSRVMPRSLKIFSSVAASRTCSTETYSSLSRLASASARGQQLLQARGDVDLVHRPRPTRRPAEACPAPASAGDGVLQFHAGLGQDRLRQSALLFEQRQQEMFDVELLLARWRPGIGRLGCPPEVFR